MSNILILSGSKRKGGNTDTLAASFAVGNVCVSGVREIGAINGNAVLKDAYEMGARIV